MKDAENSYHAAYADTEWTGHHPGDRIDCKAYMNAPIEQHAAHVLKRDTAFGRWMPVILYSVNVVGSLATAIAVGAAELLYLAVFPLPAVMLYVWRTAKGQP